MANIMCKMCGGLLALPEGITFGECPCCGSQTTFPVIPDAQTEKLYGDGERFRQAKEFDKAVAAYESLIARNAEDPEAFWGLFLSRHGIVYAEDPASRLRVPTCCLPQKAPLLEDPDYRNALKFSSDFNRGFYEKEANRIAGILKGASPSGGVKALKPLPVVVADPKPAPGAAAPSPSAADSPADLPKILKRCMILMEQHDWNAAQELCRKGLGIDPENPDLYLMQCMISRRVSNESELQNSNSDLSVDRNFQVAMKLCSPERRRQLEKIQQESIVNFHLSKCVAAKGIQNPSQLSRCHVTLSEDEEFQLALKCASPERQNELLQIQYEHADYCLGQLKAKYNVTELIRTPAPLATESFFQIALKDARPALRRELQEAQTRQSDYFLGQCIAANSAADISGLSFCETSLAEDANFKVALLCASPERRTELLKVQYEHSDYCLSKIKNKYNIQDVVQSPAPLVTESFFQIALKDASPERRTQLEQIQAGQSDFFLQKCVKKYNVSDASKLYKCRKKLSLDPDFQSARKCASREQAKKLKKILLRQSVQIVKRRVKTFILLVFLFAFLAAAGASYFFFPEIGAVIGIPEKQFEVAEHYADGIYFYDFIYTRPIDEEKAVTWYRKAADQGFPRAQAALGFRYLNGEGVEENYAEADQWFEKAIDGLKKSAKDGNPKDQYMLAQCYIAGRGVEDDIEEAKKWLGKAAKKGYAKAQSEYGVLFCSGKDAVKWIRKAAEQGYPQAQFLLGLRYASGDGVKDEDEDKAVEWIRKAAKQGCGDAQFVLGNAYKDGIGELESDDEMAFKWYLRAAKKGLVRAQYTVGKCYEDGEGVKENEKEAIKWYRKAADKDYSPAKYALERLEEDSDKDDD